MFYSDTKIKFSEKSRVFGWAHLKDPEISLEILQKAQPCPTYHHWHTNHLKWLVVNKRHYIPVKAAHMDLKNRGLRSGAIRGGRNCLLVKRSRSKANESQLRVAESVANTLKICQGYLQAAMRAGSPMSGYCRWESQGLHVHTYGHTLHWHTLRVCLCKLNQMIFDQQ